MMFALLSTDVDWLLRALLRACLLSAGRGALEAAAVPAGVPVHLSVRAQRLLRQAQISAW